MNQLPIDIQSAHPVVQAFYLRLIEQSESPRMAEMLALRSPPRALSDRELFEGVGTLEKQFAGDSAGLQSVIRSARRHGYKPNPNDFYNSSLASFPGDPAAFVPATGGRGHIKKVCEDRGLSCEGAVTVQGRQQEPQPVPLAEDLIQDSARKAVAANPGLGAVSRQELRQEMVKRHSFKGT